MSYENQIPQTSARRGHHAPDDIRRMRTQRAEFFQRRRSFDRTESRQRGFGPYPVRPVDPYPDEGKKQGAIDLDAAEQRLRRGQKRHRPPQQILRPAIH